MNPTIPAAPNPSIPGALAIDLARAMGLDPKDVTHLDISGAGQVVATVIERDTDGHTSVDDTGRAFAVRRVSSVLVYREPASG